MYKRADELVKGNVVLIYDQPQKVKKVEKLFNPGKRLDMLHVRVTFVDSPQAIFPPSEMIWEGPVDGQLPTSV